MSCIFCESSFADPIQPHSRQRICILFDVSFTGKKQLHDGKICTRCHVQVELIDNAMRLKTEMNQCLQDKLGRSEDRQNFANQVARTEDLVVSNHVNSSNAGEAKPMKLSPSLSGNMENAAPAQSMMNGHHSPPINMAQPSLLPPLQASAAEMMAMASFQSSLAALASSTPMLTLPNPVGLHGFDPASMVNAGGPGGMGGKEGVYMCVHCGKAFKDHGDLMAHDSQCMNSQTHNEMSPMGCDRCGQSLQYRSPEDRLKHIVQCKGQGLRRGRPSTGIVHCPKCGLGLKNRMNQDRVNHVQRCTGSGLKRGRPSQKSAEKFQCDKCNRNLWSRDQLEMHASKCDGNHIERRGRKPGDNCCMVCGENLIYRHILKKHLRQAHGLNPQNLDDSVIAAVKNEHSVDELSTPYKRILMNQIQQQVNMSLPNMPPHDMSATLPADQSPDSQDSLAQSFDSALSHRKKAVPCKYVAAEGDESHACDGCSRSFTDKETFDSHVCTRDALENGGGEEKAESPDDHVVVEDEMYETSSQDGLPNEANEEGACLDEPKSEPECVDDVISAISERAEAVGFSGQKGSAIAQVVSGLMDASKFGSNNTLNAAHRQSIST